MKLVGYRCDKCGKGTDDVFESKEKAPETLHDKCHCGGTYKKWDYKTNPHRWRYIDGGGGRK